MVRWVIQNNLSAEGGDFHKMAKACEELGIDYEGIKVIPFSPDIPKHTQDDKINIYYGATTLMYNIYKQHEKPIITILVFLEDEWTQKIMATQSLPHLS